MLYQSTGTLRYSDSPYKLVVEADPQLAAYYRALVPRWIDLCAPRYPAHVTVVRNEDSVILEAWRRHEGEQIEFEYSPVVRFGEIYYWLDVFCVRLEEIRRELGLLATSRFTRPPDGYSRWFHLTIGNLKVAP